MVHCRSWYNLPTVIAWEITELLGASVFSVLLVQLTELSGLLWNFPSNCASLVVLYDCICSLMLQGLSSWQSAASISEISCEAGSFVWLQWKMGMGGWSAGHWVCPQRSVLSLWGPHWFLSLLWRSRLLHYILTSCSMSHVNFLFTVSLKIPYQTLQCSWCFFFFFLKSFQVGSLSKWQYNGVYIPGLERGKSCHRFCLSLCL